MGAAIALEVGAAGGKAVGAQPGRPGGAEFGEIAVLRRLGFFALQNRDHDKHRHEPVRDVRGMSGPGAWQLLLGLLKEGHGQGDEVLQGCRALCTTNHGGVLPVVR
jgi:hypothetical protein